MELYNENYETLRRFISNKREEMDLGREEFEEFYREYIREYEEIYREIKGITREERGEEEEVLPDCLMELFTKGLECPLKPHNQQLLKRFIQSLNIDHQLYLQISNVIQMHLKIFEQEQRMD